MKEENQVLSAHNQSLLNGFLYFIKVEKGLSANSRSSYQRDILDCLLYLDKKVEEIDSHDIIDFFVNLQEAGLSSTSIARKRSALKSFFDYLAEENIVLKLKFDDVPAIKYAQRLPDVISKDEMLGLLDSIKTDDPIGWRNKAMLELMYASGLRISETINLTLHDVYWDEKVVRVLGKGSKQRLVPIAEKSFDFLLDYKNHARPALRKTELTDVLFLNRFGKKLSRMGAWKIIEKISLEFGLKKHISPHTFRHSFATHLLEAGVNLRIVQIMLGHASINTTQIYTNIDNRYIKKEHKLHHPRG
ncbi:MAG TPA: site-specific tyrosine recombinase [Candidatus Cloacimonadota bacterium]|nr:site-specific tyrosine recombinase [Candidatus Cloacimonadota bacterium]